MESRHVFTVSELNTAARMTLEQGVGTVWVQGEISELTKAPSGHLYFTLKDESSQLSAVRFKSRTSLLAPVTPEIGTVVLAQGTLTVYEPRGRYQFNVSILQPIGAGELQRAFEFLKRRLQEEGLFSEEAKLELPMTPQTIGVITSPKGAALRDIQSVLDRRWPAVRVLLFPATVQGETAPEELRTALDRAIRFSQSVHPLDVLILTRGGGSAEDLAAFNDEALARALYNCPIPVISAVGHEIDFSITDFVADRRAPTPSAAAELAVPDRVEVLSAVSGSLHRSSRQLSALWRERSDAFRLHAHTCLLRGPQRRIETYEQRLDLGLSAALRSVSTQWKTRQEAARHGSEILRLSDPRLPLQRGYSMTFRQGESRPLRTVEDLKAGDAIETQLVDGRFTSHVKEVDSHES
jgi:exodeoxyribonuclease VII large subunit